jgi:hypothetical protein
MRKKQLVLISSLLLLVSLGMFVYHIVRFEDQAITGYVLKANITENTNSTTLLFVIISTIASFFALGLSMQMPNNRMKELMSNISVAINNGETTSARMIYIQLRNTYKKLPKKDKEKHHGKCMQLYQRLFNQVLVK